MTNTQPRPVRRSPLLPALLGGLLLLGAGAGATAVLSARTQSSTETLTQDLARKLNATGKVRAEQTGYQKGFASSTQTMTVSIQPESSKPLRLLVTNHIHHGPFPALQAVGQATIDTDIRFEDPQLQAQVDQALGGQKPTMHTLVGLGGDTHSTLKLPSGQWKDNKGGQSSVLRWQALSGHVNVNGDVTTGDLNWPGLSLSDNGDSGSGEVSGITLQSRQQTPQGASLSTGSASLKVAHMVFSGVAQGKRQSFEVSNMLMASDTTLSQDHFLDIVNRYDTGPLRAGGVSLRGVQLHLGFRHLAAAPLEAISKIMNDLQSAANSQAVASTPPLSDAQTKQLQGEAMALLKGQPRITLDRLSLSPSSGEVVVTGEASAPKLAQLSSEELQMVSLQPGALLSLFQLHLDAHGSKAALSELGRMGGNGDAGQLESSLEPLLDSGYLEQQGGQLHTTLDLTDGQVRMNGKPMQR